MIGREKRTATVPLDCIVTPMQLFNMGWVSCAYLGMDGQMDIPEYKLIGVPLLTCDAFLETDRLFSTLCCACPAVMVEAKRRDVVENNTVAQRARKYEV